MARKHPGRTAVAVSLDSKMGDKVFLDGPNLMELSCQMTILEPNGMNPEGAERNYEDARHVMNDFGFYTDDRGLPLI